MEIRIARTDDAESLLKIYSYYVENTAISFEYSVPTTEEFKERIKNTLQDYPYLVAVEGEQIIGYAYASCFRTREAYKHSAEMSIYIDRNHKRSGAGRALYSEIEAILKKQSVYTVYACIASSDHNCKYLSDASQKFHTKMGYKTVGKHNSCGYKFSNWYSIIWMEKEIAERNEDGNPPDFIRFSDLSAEELK